MMEVNFGESSKICKQTTSYMVAQKLTPWINCIKSLHDVVINAEYKRWVILHTSLCVKLRWPLGIPCWIKMKGNISEVQLRAKLEIINLITHLFKNWKYSLHVSMSHDIAVQLAIKM